MTITEGQEPMNRKAIFSPSTTEDLRSDALAFVGVETEFRYGWQDEGEEPVWFPSNRQFGWVRQSELKFTDGA